MNQSNRRKFLGTATNTLGSFLAGAGLGPCGHLFAARGQTVGRDDLSEVHEIMRGLLRDYRLAGASLAAAVDGELVIAEGYGEAVVERRVPATAETLFSTASVTKPFTAVAILKQVERGELQLDVPLVELLKGVHPLPGHRIVDPRFRQVTVRHLLYHAAGFPHDVAVPEFRHGGPGPGQSGSKAELAYRRLMGQPLTFDPGSTHKYSNAGFVVAQFVVAFIAGAPYERFVQTQVLRPMGIAEMHLEKPGDYAPREAHWYLAGGRRPAVRRASNWQASAANLVTFIAHVAGSTGKPFLSEELTAEMLALPPGIQAGPKGGHVGLGWDTVQQFPGGYRFSKNGGKAGVHTWLEHLASGIDWAVMFNTDPPEGVDLLGEARRQLMPLFAGWVRDRQRARQEMENFEPPAPMMGFEGDDEAPEPETPE